LKLRGILEKKQSKIKISCPRPHRCLFQTNTFKRGDGKKRGSCQKRGHEGMKGGEKVGAMEFRQKGGGAVNPKSLFAQKTFWGRRGGAKSSIGCVCAAEQEGEGLKANRRRGNRSRQGQYDAKGPDVEGTLAEKRERKNEVVCFGRDDMPTHTPSEDTHEMKVEETSV